MSICEFNVVDGAGVQNDSLILMITDHLDWISIDEETHMNMLVKKVNAYLDFIEGKQYRNTYPNIAFEKFIIDIRCKYEMPAKCVHYLEKANICVGIGSACNEKTQTLERAIMVLTDDEKRAINMIRISLSHLNTKEEIDILIEKLKELERI
mgnify:CR=1 FL=1